MPDVTQPTHHQDDDSMPIISFLVFVYLKVHKKLFFVFQKATKNDKIPTNTLIKTGNSKKATVVVIFFGLSVPTPALRLDFDFFPVVTKLQLYSPVIFLKKECFAC